MCSSYEDYKYRISKDLFGNTLDPKKYLEEYFKTQLP